MNSFEVQGGLQLKGDITPQGAKNEALQVICAVLLSPDEVIIDNLPDILDVNNLIDLLQDLGVTVNRLSAKKCSFKAENIKLDYLKTKEFRKRAASLRGSIMIMGPLLARFGKAYFPKPGGDKIGRRRMDTHFFGFEKLGATFNFDSDDIFYTVHAEKLEGSYMLLDEASVTGTANIIMAAVLTPGKTVIYNAACEPYIQQLCRMLNSMGAKINGVGSNLLTIEGVKALKGCKHRILPDMIEIGSFIGLAAMTGSEITIKDAATDHLGIIPLAFRRMGINMHISKNEIYIPPKQKYTIETFIDGSIMTISDAPWPGLTPDLLSVFLVVATQANGSVLIHQKMFESRLFFVDKLIDMGARIILCDPHRATVIGLNHETPLRASVMTSPDIRAGVALLIAALSAKGKSIIHNIEQIDRGYEQIDQRLNQLGAKIKRI
ncbi:UDP-N-acetylglucosamine 1-carboxyvinyltransferase [Marinilabilia salmonicolor]|jgi:UDP-N-acetylglucosamine 1-carboxyvinyltransferase|uniref:UDP-N-acetylglucosamine 1-carboxyvinyltransferase n=1 Tax=Marinilabilia salmonicolor TaxID=989 RepID=A0A2T0XTA2_9BACT|nr:UDP-N-acetylglucosamine 1-carboxyvinyltransferase [Marinilabilia salmonicolor]PRZ02158.1 UDP-N-acetylglucosamine 1-carboxyvinyltransferase [Marinilabilia salmonicolor]RCW36113.1 UDP-N-acetylglucosamine 1-carboxyvinyltransferase [Marinilabilia salmonicolor]